MAVERGARIGLGRTAEVLAWDDGRVVKVLRPGFPDRLGQAEAVAAEVAARAGVDAPAFHGRTRVDGRLGLIYDLCEGPSMVDELMARPWSTPRMATIFAALHARMHASDGSGLPDLRDALIGAIGRSAGMVAAGVRDAALRRIDRLPRGTAILHGDMHPGNVVLTPAGPVVIDWLTAASGSPAADIARTLFLVRDSGLPPDFSPTRRGVLTVLRRTFASAYLAAYRRRAPLDVEQVRAWRLPILVARLDEGIASEEPMLRALIQRELR